MRIPEAYRYDLKIPVTFWSRARSSGKDEPCSSVYETPLFLSASYKPYQIIQNCSLRLNFPIPDNLQTLTNRPGTCCKTAQNSHSVRFQNSPSGQSPVQD